MKELEEEFGKLADSAPPAPTRLLRSQQAVAQATPTAEPDDTSGKVLYHMTCHVTECRWGRCHANSGSSSD